MDVGACVCITCNATAYGIVSCFERKMCDV